MNALKAPLQRSKNFVVIANSPQDWDASWEM
jgi:hypothetical protein